jgi:hypothetical protein
MATKSKLKSLEELTSKLKSLEELTEPGTELAVTPAPKETLLDSDFFQKVQDDGGEIFAGCATLGLEPGQVAGPCKIVEIRRGVQLNDKIKNVTDSYIATINRIRYFLPASASFVGKASDAEIQVGDVIAVRRGQDYINTDFNKTCPSYDIAVISRIKDVTNKV